MAAREDASLIIDGRSALTHDGQGVRDLAVYPYFKVDVSALSLLNGNGAEHADSVVHFELVALFGGAATTETAVFGNDSAAVVNLHNRAPELVVKDVQYGSVGYGFYSVADFSAEVNAVVDTPVVFEKTSSP